MKVFLSSTAQDLASYRKVADDTILSLEQNSQVMERFGAKPGTPAEECERLASQSDVLLCIVAHRYGYVPEKGLASITRREVEAAHRAKKDVLVWIVDDNYAWTGKKEQDLLADPNVVNDAARVEEVREGVAGLIDFKAWLRKTFTPETFTTPDDLGRKIAITLGNYIKGRSAQTVPIDRISIARLPTSGAELFGREAELQLLDDAWANENINIVSFVAWGGVGKTALMNHWLKKRMARDNYRRAERVFGWSFFSQGTSERAASADLFIDQALRWCGDKDPTSGSPWDKGERLARHLRQTRALLILDGLEPLQHPPGPQEGRLKDAGLQALLVELAAQQPGLCVISTRERIGDLIEFEGSTVEQRNLEHLSPQAGAQILRSFDVKGDEEELKTASRELGGHAFSLTLLGSYLNEVLDGDIGRRNEIENVFDDSRYGERAHAMIAAYERWLGEGMELAILRLLGFFDRPADIDSIAALYKPPAIVGLTEPLQNFKALEWNQAVAKLRRIKLVTESSPTEPGQLDSHPLLREHFKHEIKRANVSMWREGNRRIYEHLKTSTKQFPATVKEMSPLYAAVLHGCAAGKYDEALDDIYVDRIQRRDEYYNLAILGAFGADLSALAGFFITPWNEIVAGLPPRSEDFIRHQTGADLMALGRLQEAQHLLEKVLLDRIEKGEWTGAVTTADNLADIHLVTSELSQALSIASQAVDAASRSDRKFNLISALSVEGSAYHQLGEKEKANEKFVKAEQVQQEWKPEHKFLYSFQGYRYCQLLLDQDRTDEVRERAAWAVETGKKWHTTLDLAIYDLLLACAGLLDLEAHLAQDSDQIAGWFRNAVDGLRAAGTAINLPRGLLARARFYRFNNEIERAEVDLTEVFRISDRSGMKLHLADYHLESARLRLVQGDKDKAREHWVTARELIDRLGYHRRDKEVEEIHRQLA